MDEGYSSGQEITETCPDSGQILSVCHQCTGKLSHLERSILLSLSLLFISHCHVTQLSHSSLILTATAFFENIINKRSLNLS